MNSSLSSIPIAPKAVAGRSPSCDARAACTILVVDDQAIYREPIAAALNMSGYRTISAANGKEALLLVETQEPDLVLLDVMMPEMDAWAFLQAVRIKAVGVGLRVILLTSAADKNSILRAREFGVREYFLKERFSLDELLMRVNRCLAQPTLPKPAPTEVKGICLSPPSVPAVAGPKPSRPPIAPERSGGPKRSVVPPSSPQVPDVRITPMLTRKQVIARVDKFAEAKTLPGAVLDVINIANSPRSSMEDLVSALKRDPVLASRILQVANSPAYASRKGRVTTVEESVRNMGLGAVAKIAASVGIFEAFGANGPGGIDALRCWQHFFAVADIMDRFVKKTDAIPAGLPHLIGLCHDLGELVLRQQFAEEFAVASEIAANSGKPLEQIESEVFGIAHQELVGLLSAKLGLPAIIADPIDEFHSGQTAKKSGSNAGLAKALSMANSFAHGLLLASSPEAPVSPFLPAECRYGFGANSSTSIDLHTFRGEVIINTNLLAKLSAADEAALSLPLLPAREVKIWYTRHDSLSPFDPLGVALELLAETEAHDTPPAKPDDAAGYAGIVMAFPRPAPGTTPLIQIERLRASIQNPALPVLCLSASGPDPLPTCSGNTEFVEYPVPLAKLHQFVSKL